MAASGEDNCLVRVEFTYVNQGSAFETSYSGPFVFAWITSENACGGCKERPIA